MSNHRGMDKFFGKSGLTVIVKNNDIGRGWRNFKRLVENEGVLQDLRLHEAFESKGAKRRRKQKEADRRYRKIRMEAKLMEEGKMPVKKKREYNNHSE